MPRSPKQETNKRKKKYEHSPSDEERKASRGYKNIKQSEPSHSDDDDNSHRRPSSRNGRNDIKSFYKEPLEARTPERHWRLSVYKDGEDLPTYRIYRQSKYIFGRDKDECDIRLHHPSCSNIHAVLQYRLRPDSHGRHVFPYLIDLGSAHGTFLNRRRIDENRYYKLEENDVLQFGESSKEFTLFDSDSSNKHHNDSKRSNQHKHHDNKTKSSDDDENDIEIPDEETEEEIIRRQRLRREQLKKVLRNKKKETYGF
jgi:smad nuclear-interacting protein 1